MPVPGVPVCHACVTKRTLAPSRLEATGVLIAQDLSWRDATVMTSMTWRPDKLSPKLEKCVDQAMDEGHRTLDSALAKSNVICDPAIANKEPNKVHIDFHPCNREGRKQFNALTRDESQLRFDTNDIEGFNALMTQPLQVRKEFLKELPEEELCV